MWSAGQTGGGGFMNTSLSSPSQQGSGGTGGKAKRAQNVVPVLIEEVLKSPEEGFTIEGTEVCMVKIVGSVTNLEKSATKCSYQIEDGSGSIECVQWVEEGQEEEQFAEGSTIKVIGSVRTQGEKKHIMTIKIMEVKTEEEKDFHALEVAYSHLKLKQISAHDGGVAGGGGAVLSNSMMGGGSFGGGAGMGGGSMGGAGNTFAASSSFGNKNYDAVYGHIKRCHDEHGINLGVLFNEIKGKMSKQEMDSAIDFLSSEGHIYSTVDDEHYKTTDED